MTKNFKNFIEFTFAPLLIISVAIIIFLFFNWLFSKETNTEKLLQELITSSGSRKWQIAYDLTTSKHLNYIKDNENAYTIIYNTLKESLSTYENIPQSQKDNAKKSIEYLIYLLSFCNNANVNTFFRENLLHENNKFLQPALLAVSNTKRVELISDILKIYHKTDIQTQLIIIYVSGVLGTSAGKQFLLNEFQSADTLKKLNSAFALARLKELEVLSYLKHLLENENYRKIEIKDKNEIRLIKEEETIPILENILKSLYLYDITNIKQFAPVLAELESKTKYFTISRLCKELILKINNAR